MTKISRDMRVPGVLPPMRMCQDCPHRAGACGPGLMLLNRLQGAVATARMGPEFELTGTLAVAGCVRPCLLAWRVSAAGAWVFGDVSEGADVDVLVAKAQAAPIRPAAVLMTHAGMLN